MKKHIVFWSVIFAIYIAATLVWIIRAPAATQIGTDQIKNSAITNPKIANDAVTDAKFDSASGITVATASVTGTATATKLVSTGDVEAAATGSFADIDVSDHVGAARIDVTNAITAGSAKLSGILDMAGFGITNFAAVAAGSTEFRYTPNFSGWGLSGFTISEGDLLFFPSAASGTLFAGHIPGAGAGYFGTNGAGDTAFYILFNEGAGVSSFSIGATGTNGTISIRDSANLTKITLAGGTGIVSATGGFSGTGSSLTNVDAATVDSLHASAFVRDTGDNMTGSLTNNVTAGTAVLIKSTGDTTATATLYVTSNNTHVNSNVIDGYNTGTGGSAGYFYMNNAANANPAVYVHTDGRGRGLYSVINNTDNDNAALYGWTNGTNVAGLFTISAPTNANSAVYASSDGTGAGMNSYMSGTGVLYKGTHAGASGNLITLTDNGVAAFSVSHTGSATASGTITINGIGTIDATGGYKVGAAIGATCTLTMDLSATATVSITKGIITGCTGPACSCP